MNQDLLKILADHPDDVDNQKLMDYLSGRLSEADAHEVEKLMAEDELVGDAMEGLQQVKGNQRIEALVDQLHKDLHRKLEQKKQIRHQKKLQEHPWVYLAVVLVLLLIICSWFVLQRMHPIR